MLTKHKIAIIAIAILLFSGAALRAQAATIMAQTENVGTCNTGGAGCATGYTAIPYTGTATSTIAAVQVYLSGTTGDYYRFQSNGPQGITCTITGNLSTTTAGSYFVIPCDSGSNTQPLIPGTYIEFSSNQNGLPSVSAGQNHVTYPGTGFNWYFELFDTLGNQGTNTGFVDPYTPANGAVFAATTTTFVAPYYFNCNTDFGKYDTVSLKIQDNSDPGNSPYVTPQTIGTCGGASFSASVSLVLGHSYLWQPKMYLAGTTSPALYGNWYFYQSTSSPAFTPFTPYAGGNNPGLLSTSTNPIPIAPCGITDVSGCFQNAISYLFYPTVDFTSGFLSLNVQNRLPFVYVYQLGQIRATLFSASSTAPTALTVALWKLPGSTSTTTITLISQSEIAAVPFSGTIYDILTFLIWLGMAEYIYYRVIRMHDTNTPS